MSLFESLVMGIIQGLTEFLPVSSSGHLALLGMIFSGSSSIDFTFLLHIGTFLATIVFFRHELVAMIKSLAPKNKHMKGERHMVLALIIATAVTGPIGLILEPKLDKFSNSLVMLGCSFLLTTVVLSAAEFFSGNRGKRDPFTMSYWRAAFIGLAQGIAVLPGLSRSGATIAGGMGIGLSREKATRFSFFLALPIIFVGALKDGVALAAGELVLPGFWICLVGFVASFVAGYLAIRFMIDLVRRVKLYWFAGYTAVLGIVLLVLHFTGIA